MTPTSPDRDSQIRTTALVVLSFIAVAASLYFLRPVLLPFVLALFIASGVVPILGFVERYFESSRPIAVVITLGTSLLITGVFTFVIWISVGGLVSNRALYQDGVVRMKDRARDMYNLLVPETEVPEFRPAAVPPPIDPLAGEPATSEAMELATTFGQRDSEAAFNAFLQRKVGEMILALSNELFAVLSSGLLVLIFLFFLLLGGTTEVKLPANNLWGEVDKYIRNYIVSKTLISLVTGLVFGAVLWLCGVPLAFVFGLLAVLLNFIPNLGPIIATVLPLPLMWIMVESHWAAQAREAAGESVGAVAGGSMSLGVAIVALVLGGLVQFVSGNVVEPKIMGDQFKLHPVAILLSLMFWYMIWGITGAFLAIPITSALKIILAESPQTRRVAELLEGDLAILERRPPATPIGVS